MGYTELKIGEIDTSVIYVSKAELMKRTGVSKSTMHLHIQKGMLEALRFRNRTYFRPEVADEYEKLAKANLLERRGLGIQ